MMKILTAMSIALALAISAQGVTANPALPGAEGYGTNTEGGRQGVIFEIDSVSDLKRCVSSSMKRFCIFTKGGTYTIDGELDIRSGDITLVGTTAPGDGVTISGSGERNSVINVDDSNVILHGFDVVARTYGENARALSVSNRGNAVNNVVIDHVGLYMSGDEVFIAWYDTHDVTVSNSHLAMPLMPDGKGPLLGAVNHGGGNYSFHHNMVAHIRQRAPRIRTDEGMVVDVAYNFITANLGGGDSEVDEPSQVNYFGNVVWGSEYSSYVDSESPVYVDADNIIYDDDWNITARGRGVARSRTDVRSVPFKSLGITGKATGRDLADYILKNSGNSYAVTCSGVRFQRRTPFSQMVVDETSQGRHVSNSDPEFFQYRDNPGVECSDADGDSLPDMYEARFGSITSVSPWQLSETGWSHLETYAYGMLSNGPIATSTPQATASPTPIATSTRLPSPTPIPTTVPSEPDEDGLVDVIKKEAEFWTKLLRLLERLLY